jgi:opacity protein-like surface antigen
MRRVMRVLVLTAAVAFVLTPAQVRAEGYVNPWLGGNFGNSSAEGKVAFGVNAGGMGAGIIGGELSFGFAPDFFGESVENSVLDLMGNLIIGIPVGGTSGPGIRPFVTGGLGLIRTSIDAPGVDAANDFGYNLGGGVMGYFTDHIGLRGDVRYLRTLNSEDLDAPGVPDIDLGSFHFWRATIGLVIR